MRGVLIDHRRHAFAAATLVAAVLVVLGWAVLRAPGGAGAASNRLNLVVILADDAALRTATPDDERAAAARCARDHVHERLRHDVGVLPVASLDAHGPVFAHDRCDPELRADELSALLRESNLAVWLHDAGYETALVGKYLNDYTVYGNHHVPPGWSTWVAIDSVPEERYYDYTLNENGKLVHYGTRVCRLLDRRAGGARRVDFVRVGASEPFFLYFAPIAPHLPAIPAPRDVGDAADAVEAAARASTSATSPTSPGTRSTSASCSRRPIHYLDHDDRGRPAPLPARPRPPGRRARWPRSSSAVVLDRTVVLYVSDNGFLWGEHRLGGKIWPYEESIRVPLVVRVPWKSAWGTHRQPLRPQHRLRLDHRRSSPASSPACRRTAAASSRS